MIIKEILKEVAVKTDLPLTAMQILKHVNCERCESNGMCQEGYCCLFSISRDLPRECVPALSIKNYQGKSYLCDPPDLINEESLKNENNKNLIEIIIKK
jgi:hypothetical protein